MIVSRTALQSLPSCCNECLFKVSCTLGTCCIGTGNVFRISNSDPNKERWIGCPLEVVEGV